MEADAFHYGMPSPSTQSYTFSQPQRQIVTSGNPFSSFPHAPSARICEIPSDSASIEPYLGEAGAAKIREIARNTPRRDREKVLKSVLGELKGIQVIDWLKQDMMFVSRVTTDRYVLRGAFALDRQKLATDAAEYDPWGCSRWFDHAKRVFYLFLAKSQVDAGDLYAAEITRQMRSMMLTEKPSLIMNDPEDVFAPADGAAQDTMTDQEEEEGV